MCVIANIEFNIDDEIMQHFGFALERIGGKLFIDASKQQIAKNATSINLP